MAIVIGFFLAEMGRKLQTIGILEGNFSKIQHDIFLKLFIEPDYLETEIIELLRDQA